MLAVVWFTIFCILLISGIHTATGPKHGTHHWYPDLDYMRSTYGEGTKVMFIERIQRYKFYYSQSVTLEGT